MIDDLRSFAGKVKRRGKTRLKKLVTSRSRVTGGTNGSAPSASNKFEKWPVAPNALQLLTRRIEVLERQVARETDRSREREAAAVLTNRSTIKTIVAVVERRSSALADRFLILQRELDTIRTVSSQFGREALEDKGLAKRAIDAAESAGREIAAVQRLLERTTEEVQATVQSIVSRLDDFAENVRAAGFNRADDLVRSVERLDTEITQLVTRHRATPFMTRPVFPSPARAANLDEGFDYLGFEEIFRGSSVFIADRQRAYEEFLYEGQRVFDLGCGRGEFLELARKAGAAAVGVDCNAAMAAHCAASGLEVCEADALAFLNGRPSASADLIFSAQFIEHVAPDYLHALFVAARRVLAPGGTFIAETVNPHSLEALKCFYVDLTHVKPIFPEVSLFFARSAGFADAQIFYPTGNGFDEREPWNRGEYALIATTQPPHEDARAEA